MLPRFSRRLIATPLALAALFVLPTLVNAEPIPVTKTTDKTTPSIEVLSYSWGASNTSSH
jgi:hypothetical protein